MADTGHSVLIDAQAWRRIERQAEDTGQTPSEVVRTSLRRGLAGEVLAELRARVRSRQPLDDDAAIATATAERLAIRAERSP